MLDVLEGFPVLFVGLRCSLPELQRREQDRGNRGVGRAAAQYPLVHAHDIYDLEVDSEHNTPTECALLIRGRLDEGSEQWTAFVRLRAAD